MNREPLERAANLLGVGKETPYDEPVGSGSLCDGEEG